MNYPPKPSQAPSNRPAASSANRPIRTKKSWWPLIKKLILAGLACAVLGFFALTVFAAWVSRDLPDPNTLSQRQVPQSTKIYDRTGEHLLYEVHGDENRTLVKIDDIPLYMRQATIAIEDRRFYEHHGIYWLGLVRAFANSILKQQKVQGTSTLTQQFVKNAFLTNDRTPSRKLKEFIVSLQIERRFSKDEILQLYLNEIPYGSTVYGVESAARTFFGKSVGELTLDEAALLASIPQRPTFFSPNSGTSTPERRQALVNRQHTVLYLMEEQGFITAEERDAAVAVDTLAKVLPKRVGNIEAPHFVMYVRDQLEEKYGVRQVQEGGLKVITTLDYDKQKIAEEEVKKGVEKNGTRYNFSNAALISLDPKTGQILAMVGSKDFFADDIDGQYNVTTLAERQPGSSFKPIVYAAAFQKGYLPQTVLWDVFTSFKTDAAPYEPRNYDGKDHGPVSLRTALQGSLNIPAVKTLYLVGVSRALDFAQALGYTTLNDRNRFGLALALGGGEVRPIEHASTFATFANEGTKLPTSSILKIEDASGDVLEEWKQPEGERVMDVQTARLLSNVLSDNNARSYVFGTNNSLTLPDRPVAAKTGTTNDYHDAWTVGYTPGLVGVVWVGNNDHSIAMKRGADGSIIAAPIWQAYMRRSTSGTPVERFTDPEPPTTDKPALLGYAMQVKAVIDTVSGKLATEFTPENTREERTFYDAHSILYYLDKDNPTGDRPENPATDPQFVPWETAVTNFVKSSGWNATSTLPTEYDDVHTASSQPSVNIFNPGLNSTLTNRQTSVLVGAFSERRITRMEIRIDDTLVGSLAQDPWNVPITIPNSIDNGPHTLTARAIDELGNFGESSINIQLNAPSVSTPPFSITSPARGQTWSRSDFPKTVRIALQEPTRYARLDVVFVGNDGIVRTADSITLPTSSEVEAKLQIAPGVGSYELRVIGYPQDTSSASESVSTNITITE